MKIAIVRLSSLGDVISTAVFLKLIKEEFIKKYGMLEITFIVDSSFRQILQDSPYIDTICDIPLRESKKNKKKILEIFSALHSLERFDMVIDFQGLLKSALIGKMLKSNEFVGYSKNGAREKAASLFYTQKVDVPYKEHILKRQYEVLKAILGLEDSFKLEMLSNRDDILCPSNRAKEKIDTFIESAKTRILFILEASKPEKEYPLDLFYEVAMGLKMCVNDIKIYLIWDKKEREIKNLGQKDEVFCVLEKLNLDEIKALLSKMNLVVGGDTGITHLSWALNVPAITLYGNTPLKRFVLGGDNFISISHLDIDDTIKGDFSIQKIEPARIIESALKLLGKNKESSK